MKILLTTFAWIFVCVPMVFGASSVTFEETVLSSVSVSISEYRKIHKRLPNTWGEIGTRMKLDLANEAMKDGFGYSFTERYEFMTKNLPMYSGRGSGHDIEEGSRVILARVTPFRDHRTDGLVFRTFVYETGLGEIRVATLLEEQVRKLARTYGVTLPMKAGVPPVESNEPLSQSRKPQKLPDPSDARRILHSGSGEDRAGVPAASEQSTAGTSDMVIAATNGPSPSGGFWDRWFPYAGFAGVLAVAGWLFLRTKRKNG